MVRVWLPTARLVAVQGLVQLVKAAASRLQVVVAAGSLTVKSTVASVAVVLGTGAEVTVTLAAAPGGGGGGGAVTVQL